MTRISSQTFIDPSQLMDRIKRDGLITEAEVGEYVDNAVKGGWDFDRIVDALVENGVSRGTAEAVTVAALGTKPMRDALDIMASSPSRGFSDVPANPSFTDGLKRP